MEQVIIHGKPVRLGKKEKSTARTIRIIGYVFAGTYLAFVLVKIWTDGHRDSDRANAAHTSAP
jgi:hypothetical protein